MDKPRISIIIPVKNNAPVIGDALTAVFNQRTREPFEVIVIDSGSSDETVRICAGFPVKMLAIKPHEFGHGRTRVFGARQAAGEIIVFLNGDAVPADERWLEALCAGVRAGREIAGAYSRLLPARGCNPLSERDILTDTWLFSSLRKSVGLDGGAGMSGEEWRKVCSFHTVSCAIPAALLAREPFADIEFGEDLEWSQRMLKAGYTIAYEPGSRVFHSHELTLSETAQRYFDDTVFNRVHMRRWRRRDCLKIPFIFASKTMRDIPFILRSTRNMRSKLAWLAKAPFYRSAEAFGMLMGFFPPPKAEFLSLVHKRKNS